MMGRRELLTMTGLLGGFAAPAAGEGVAAGAGQLPDRQMQDLVNAISGIAKEIARQNSFAEIAGVRKGQLDFFRANGKFPDFIDTGSDVWMSIYDWHVRMQQPLVVSRDANGRYTMMLGFTALVLRQDYLPNLIGIPYDQR